MAYPIQQMTRREWRNLTGSRGSSRPSGRNVPSLRQLSRETSQPGVPRLCQPEAAQQALLGLALNLGEDFDLPLQRGAADLRRQQVVDLEDARRVVELDLDPNGVILAGADPHLVDPGG